MRDDRQGRPPPEHQKDIPLTVNTNKSREQAEAAFSKTQTQTLARSRMQSEHDAVSNARDEKTARLRQLRLEKEAADALLPPAPSKRATKR